MTQDEAPIPTLEWVAKKMGYSVSGVSLIRSGNRQPTLITMDVVEKAFDWPVTEQVLARRNQKYAEEFNKVISERFNNEKQEN